jgi:hypothetical protein
VDATRQTLESEPVIRMLFEICQAGQSGVLEVEADGVCTAVYLARGVPVFAEEGTLGETLGRLLLRDGVLSQDQYARIIERMTSSVMGAEQMRFGEIAVALGCLTPQQVNEALARQVRRKLVRCIGAAAPSCVFREDLDALGGIARYPCAIEPLILRTVCSSFDERRVTQVLSGTADRYPQLLQPAEQVSQQFGMSAAERALLEEIDGVRITAELVATTPLVGLQATQVLAVLALAGLVRFNEQPAGEPARLREGAVAAAAPPTPEPPAAVLVREAVATAVLPQDTPSPDSPPGAVSAAIAPPTGPTRRPSDAARLAARQRLARRLAPRPEHARLASRGRRPAPVQPKPSAPSQSLPPVAKHARLRAEQLFQSGKLHVRHERWPLAHHDLQEAARLYPDAIEYQLYAEWARFQTLTDTAELGPARVRLEQLATQALRQDRQLGFAHHVAAQVKLMQGDEHGALRSFRIASRLDPDDKVAARYYRMLKRKQS